MRRSSQMEKPCLEDAGQTLKHCFPLFLATLKCHLTLPSLPSPRQAMSACSWRYVTLKVLSLLLFFHLGRKGVVLGKHCCWSGCHVCSSHGWAIERGIEEDSGGQMDREKQWFVPFHFVCSGTVQKAKCSVHSGFRILWSTSEQIHLIDFVGRVEKRREQCFVRCLWTKVMRNVFLDSYGCFLNFRHFYVLGSFVIFIQLTYLKLVNL